MIEARFDDLILGAERSFRLVGPVGILEARRAAEVVGVLDAAEAAVARGMWVGGFVAYEAAPGLDPELAVRVRPPDDPFADMPLAWFAMFEGREDIATPEAPKVEPAPAHPSAWRPSADLATYGSAIDRIRELIAAGHTYQVNHTIRLRAAIAGDERDFYRDLCLAQRGGYAAYLDTGRYRVLSASPELFFRIDGDDITTRPMKGTAPRGRWPAEDEDAAARLVASAKERAENAMIVDLLRNDLGRICRPGSVRVERMWEAERYETVWQLTSTVAGRLREGAALREVFRSLFPSGSVTGAPKVRTMRIIADLEDSARGPYCGAVGYIAPAGSGEPRANFNVAIRTVVLDTRSRVAEYGVGGAITFDSSAADEYAEVLAKARVLTAARPTFELIETLAHEPGAGFRHLAEHLDRMGASARYFGFRYEREAAAAALKDAVADREAVSRVRLALARDGSLETSVDDLPPDERRPARVAIVEDPIDPKDPFVFHKTSRRAPYDRRRLARPDVDDVLLVNDRGEVTESTIANLAVRIDGVWMTPPIEAGLLPGIFRDALIFGGTLLERRVSIEEARAAEGLALVSSVRGWRSAVLFP